MTADVLFVMLQVLTGVALGYQHGWFSGRAAYHAEAVEALEKKGMKNAKQ